MTLLSMVNQLRDLLRENRVSTVTGTNAGDVVVQKALINRAARKVLAARTWSFTHRNDGYLFFPGRYTATSNFVVNAAGTAVFTLGGMPNATALAFSDGSVVAKVVFTGSSFPETSYVLHEIVENLGIGGTLATTFQATYSGAGIVYANEAAFPSNVSRVLSIRNEEGYAITFETMDTFDDFDDRFPHDAERFGDRPEFVAIGGAARTTARSFTPTPIAARVGLGIRIFPPPDAGVTLRYSYTVRPTEMVNDTDELTGVPEEFRDHIVSVAFQQALMGSIEDDPARGRTVLTQNELEMQRLVTSDRRDAGRRHVPSPFSSRMGWNRRVLDRSVPEP